MKIYSTNRINALGLKGPEETHNYFPEAEYIQVDNGNIQESEQILYNKAKEIFANSGASPSLPSTIYHLPSREKPAVFLGGDHSITYPIFKAFQQSHKNPFLIIFDAHADCMPHTQEPTHEEFLEAIISNGFPPEKIILIGLRKVEREEKEFLDKHKIKILQDPKQIINLTKNHDLYVSIDIDALDPSIAPAVNYPEPNGLSEKEFFQILIELLKQNPKAIDIVEAVPEKDQDNKTLKLITEIIKEATNLS